MHVCGIERAVEQFCIATAAVNVLFVLHCELQHQRLVGVGERLELSGGGVELGILKS